MRKISGIVLVLLFIGLAATSFFLTTQLKQNLTGTVKVKHPPVIQAMQLYYDDDGGTTQPSTELTPMDEETLIITVNFTDPGYIYSVEVIIYYNLVGISAPDNASHHVTITWDNVTNTWHLSSGGSTTWALDTDNSTVPGNLISGTADIKVVFTPGKITRYSASGNWVIYANVTDQDNPNLLYGEGNITSIDARYYLEMHVDTTSFDFGNVPPGCTNVSLKTPANAINVTVISNYWWKMTLNATGWYNASNPTQLVVNFTEFNSLLADDDPNPTEATETNLNPIWVRPSGSVWDNLDPTQEGGTTIHLYLFVTLPTDIPYGTYTTTMSIITGQSAPPP